MIRSEVVDQQSHQGEGDYELGTRGYDYIHEGLCGSLLTKNQAYTEDGTKRCQSLHGPDCKILHYGKRRRNNINEAL